MDELPPERPAIVFVRLEDIVSAEFQPRQSIDERGIEGLASDIGNRGMLQPILLKPEAGGKYTVVAGQRRVLAARRQGWSEIPAVVRDRADVDAAEDALVENVQREQLNPVEEARALQRLRGEHGYSVRDLARRLSKSTGYVHGRLDLLRHEDVATAVHDGEVGIWAAGKLARIDDDEARREAREALKEHKPRTREEIERLIDTHAVPAKSSTAANRVEAIERAWTRLSRRIQLVRDADEEEIVRIGKLLETIRVDCTRLWEKRMSKELRAGQAKQPARADEPGPMKQPEQRLPTTEPVTLSEQASQAEHVDLVMTRPDANDERTLDLTVRARIGVRCTLGPDQAKTLRLLEEAGAGGMTAIQLAAQADSHKKNTGSQKITQLRNDLVVPLAKAIAEEIAKQIVKQAIRGDGSKTPYRLAMRQKAIPPPADDNREPDNDLRGDGHQSSSLVPMIKASHP